MFERFKRVLVESYIGAIALGYMLAEDIVHFVNIFSSPVVAWVTRNEYREFEPRPAGSGGFSLEAALPELMGFLVLLLVWYALFRWLYLKPFQKGPSETT